MKRWCLLLLILPLFFAPQTVLATHFSDIVRGRIILDVENNGEAWYVYPPTMRRYYLGRPADAFNIMRELGLGITNDDLESIPLSGQSQTGDLDLRERLSGRILLQVESVGQAWYVHPVNLQRYYLGRPTDAFNVMSELGLGISAANLAHIPIDTASLEPVLDELFVYREFTLTNDHGSFPIHVLTLSMADYEMVTDTAEADDCTNDCAATSLKSFVKQNFGFAGINGTYFCPPDYAPCQNQINTFLPPVYNSALERLINEDTLRFHNRPMITYSEDGEYRYFHRSSSFGDDVPEFEETYDTDLLAAIGSWPSLVENGVAVIEDEPSEPGFFVRSTRGGVGWNHDVIFLLIAESATMEEFASVFLSLGAQSAMNLDGGGSAALFVDGSYLFGPGRLLPNAVIFREK